MSYKTRISLLVLMLAFSGPTWAADQNSNQNGDQPPMGRHDHHHLQLTDAQKACLKEQGLPAPGEGERPSRDKVEAAFKACNIKPPRHGRGGPPADSSQESASGTAGAGSAE